MTRDPVAANEDTSLDELVHLMEENGIRRLPVLRGDKLVGIITVQFASGRGQHGQEIPDPTADDEHIRDRIVLTLEATDWRPTGLQVAVRNGVVHLHRLIINDDIARRASIVAAENTAGVKEVHDHLCYVDSWSGLHESPEDMKAAS